MLPMGLKLLLITICFLSYCSSTGDDVIYLDQSSIFSPHRPPDNMSKEPCQYVGTLMVLRFVCAITWAEIGKRIIMPEVNLFLTRAILLHFYMYLQEVAPFFSLNQQNP